jgi:radical SAM superfamily enzyme YgiQ (UPF0313 family)
MKYDVVLFTGYSEGLVKTFGAYKCAHELRLAGYCTLVVDHSHHFDESELTKILNLAVGDNTLFIGFSNTFMSADYEGHIRSRKSWQGFLPQGAKTETNFRQYLNKINPNTKIVLGGCRTFFNLYNPNIDYAIIGYADLSIVNLANHLRHAEPLKKARRNLNKITVIDDPVADGFDFPNSDMIWTDDDVVIKGENLPIEISRGCIFSCKFCNYRLNGKKNLDYLKNYQTIREELIRNYENYNITTYRFLDDTFNDTEEKLDVMVDIVKSLPFRPKFWAYIRLDLLAKHPRTIQKLVDIGVEYMFFGIETLNQKAGRVIGKAYNPQEQIATINQIKKDHPQVHLHGSFICGLPEESIESVKHTMDMIYQRQIDLDTVFYWPLNLTKQDRLVWQSAFNLDMQKYGYKEMPGTENDDLEQIIWFNNHMNYPEAKKLCLEFMDKCYANHRFTETPIDTFLNNNHLENFIKTYKKTLFKYLYVQSKI